MSRLARSLDYVSGALRLLPPGLPGKSRLARHLLGGRLRVEDAQLRDRFGCMFVVPSLLEPIGFHLLVDGVYEIEGINLVLSRVRTGSVFVDVGANIGVFTLPSARKVGPTGQVIAIEASPTIFRYLERNLIVNGLSNVRPVQCAAFDRSTPVVEFYEAPVEHFGMGALAAQFHTSPVPVPARTLDDILSEHGISRVDVLKVDVEGFEGAVFRGAGQLLTKHEAPLVLFEFCDWAEARSPRRKVGDAQRALRDWGYRIWRLQDFLRQGPSLTRVLTIGFETLVAKKDV